MRTDTKSAKKTIIYGTITKHTKHTKHTNHTGHTDTTDNHLPPDNVPTTMELTKKQIDEYNTEVKNKNQKFLKVEIKPKIVYTSKRKQNASQKQKNKRYSQLKLQPELF